MLELTIIYLVSIAIVALILVLVSDYLLNDSDQERLNEEYSKKAKQHNELMVKKESRNGS